MGVKQKSKVFALACIFVVLALIGFVFYKILQVESQFRYTTDLNHYGAEEYPLPETVFPKEFPAGSVPISFSYYYDWHEAADYYLELKFDCEEKMNAYLFDIKEKANEGKKSFFEEKNPYSDSFVDLFFEEYATISAEQTYTGYSVEVAENVSTYKCNFGVISYSKEKLIVIHTYAYGCFSKQNHDHIPQYLKTFDVPLNETHKRVFVLE